MNWQIIQGVSVIEKRMELANMALLCPDCHHWVHSTANKDGEFLG